ncbi:MAG: hypothetical protein WAT91_09965 [Saprospiraceae bacterium]
MERRNFIQKSVIGVAGFNLLGLGSNVGHLFQAGVVHEWFYQFVKATSVRHKTGLFLPVELCDTIKSLNANFAKYGFTSHHSGYYFYSGTEDYCFYALEFKHSASGMTDILIPVLHQEKDGSWKQFTTINGYQLEALVKSVPSLENNTESIADLILPVKKEGVSVMNGYCASHADVRIVTRIVEGKKGITSVSITNPEKSFFNEVIDSGHCLTSISTQV